MAHHIQVILAREELIERLVKAWQHAHKLSLPQEFALIPMIRVLLEDMDELINRQEPPPYSDFAHLSASIAEVLSDISHHGPVAYLETEYFGGAGTQSALLFHKQQLQSGPHKTETRWNQELESYQTLPEGASAINRVLKELGVRRSETDDEFDSLQLGHYRGNERILKKIGKG